MQAPSSCILFSTADWDEPYWTNKQHCAKSLSELGTKVLYVESVGLRSPKAGSAKDRRRLWDRFKKGMASLMFGAVERSSGIYVLSPLQIPSGYHYGATRILNRLLLEVAIKRAARQHRLNKPLIWTYHPFMLDALQGMVVGPLLYHCVDDIAAIPGIDAQIFRSAERVLLARANIVFATAPSLEESCKQYNPNTHYLSNVVDAEHFGRALESGPIPDDLAVIPEPRLCYHGVLSDFKVDFQLLLECACLKPEWSWVLIGDEREGQQSKKFAQLVELPNVYHLGYKNYEVLPQYLRGMQVGLLPSQINKYTRSMFPMKYYEYLAAGIPVVSTSIAFTDVIKSNLKIARNTREFINCIEVLISQGRHTKEKSLQLVGKNTWLCRTKRMIEKI